MGVPKQDIVIGFHTPKMRQLTGFGGWLAHFGIFGAMRDSTAILATYR
jgi:hypothetical protein